jgi:hypothetical protein
MPILEATTEERGHGETGKGWEDVNLSDDVFHVHLQHVATLLRTWERRTG